MVEFLIYCIASFLSGILSFMAPCTLPLLPAYFGYANGLDRKDTINNTLFFMFGLASSFTLLGVFAGSIGAVTLSYKKELTFVFALFLIIFGFFSIIGKNIKFDDVKIRYKKTHLGSILFGALFGLVWSGCIGPVVGFMLILAANSGTALSGGILLFIHSLGLLFPLLIFSLFLSRLPTKGKFWRFMRGKLFHFKIFNKDYYVHSTNLVTGLLFLFLGVFMFLEINFGVTRFLFPGLNNIIFDVQDLIIEFFNLS